MKHRNKRVRKGKAQTRKEHKEMKAALTKQLGRPPTLEELRGHLYGG